MDTASPAAPMDELQNINYLNEESTSQLNLDLHARMSQRKCGRLDLEQDPSVRRRETRELTGKARLPGILQRDKTLHWEQTIREGKDVTMLDIRDASTDVSDDAISGDDREHESDGSQHYESDELPITLEAPANTEPPVSGPMFTSHEREATEPVSTKPEQVPRDLNENSDRMDDFDFPMNYDMKTQCVEPHLEFFHETDIPTQPTGNCLFHSLIITCNLNIDPLTLRRILRNSSHIESCAIPADAKRILESDNEQGMTAVYKSLHANTTRESAYTIKNRMVR
ncbi:hypothetical protein QAD02_021650 [Eretmocerus hayati]|uniref:Uncharacterized protein n=1 Tax=Eretmocerus hayati TaxID=131215 RepID=A0ACC2PU02_9HYME|nr:hypothetical protein QAD02_021650 [Eretmocerus hayati]